MNLKKDYYRVLGVGAKASSNEIRRAYRHLAILNHPDRNPSTQATLRMQEINEAYGILSDKRKRTKYDSERGNSSAGFQATSAPQATTATMNLQQIFAEDITERMNFLPLAIAITVLMSSIGVVIWSTSLIFHPPWWVEEASWYWKPMIIAFSITVLSSVSLSYIFSRMSSKSNEIEAQCPKCGKDWAAEKLSETLVGVSQRYKTHYKCKYCFYEWQFIKTKRRNIL